MNAARKAYGLRPLRLDPTLAHAAQAHSSDMLRRDYFAHGNFPGRMAAFRVTGHTAGENLAWGSGPYGRAGEVVQEWLASPEHRANLLGTAFSRIGIGLARGTFLGTGDATVVTADFAG
ncbi:MAG TPA: CAP domain-containing protein [Gaiellaceae bacterium]